MKKGFKIRKIFLRLKAKNKNVKNSFKICIIKIIAFIENLNKNNRIEIVTQNLNIADKNDIIINLFGNINAVNEINIFKNELNSLSDIVKEADISFTTVRRVKGKKHFIEQLADKGYTNVFDPYSYISGRLIKTDAGNIGVISYIRYAKQARNEHIKVKLMASIQEMKKNGADYIFLYVNNINNMNFKVSEKESNLFETISKMGVDYIVGVTPNIRDSGQTYLCGNKIIRSIYSIGSFLSENNGDDRKLVVIRLVLRNINGKLALLQETYIPMLLNKGKDIRSLVCEKDDIKNLDSRSLKYLSEIEQEMTRIKPINRMLTVGKLAEIIDVELPEKYKYLEDFSVGKVCARSFECAPGDVFFFRNPFNDPNDLVPENVRARINMAKRMAKRCLIVFSYKPIPVKNPYVIMNNTVEAHISACAYLRSQFPVKYIGVTGSVGKTSVKDLLFEVVNTKYNTLKSERNSNVQVKIGIDIQKLRSDTEVYIQEVGGGRPGGASRHSRMFLPDITVLTNIGDAHIGNFYGDKEKLMFNKLAIGEGMTENGTMFINADDELLVNAKPSCNTVFYAMDNKNADYYAEDFTEESGQTFFKVIDRKNNTSTNVTLNVLGYHNVLNAVCCFAIGKYLNIDEADIVKGLANFKTSGIRQNLNKLSGVNLFMDCYNASSNSMKSSLRVLAKIDADESAKRIAIIGDITGMGDLSEDIHIDVAETIIDNPADHVIFFGSQIKKAYDIVSSKGFSCFYTLDRKKLNRHIREVVKPGDVIMAKGSSKVLLEYSIDSVFGTRFTDQRLLDEVEFRRARSKGITYNVFEHYATAIRSDAKIHDVHIKKRIAGVPVVNFGTNVANSQTVKVHLPDSIRHIAGNAFKNCENLSSIRLSSGIKFISTSAFMNCNSLKELKFNDGLLHIGYKAFFGCNNLESLYLPESVAQIGKGAFAECPKLTVYCKEGSYAADYLKKNKINHKYF